MSADIDDSWSRIERWLAGNAPLPLDTLNPPATRESLDELRRTLDFPLPDQLVASLLRHDGSHEDPAGAGHFVLPGGYRLLSVAQIGQFWRRSTDILLDSRHRDMLTGVWWHRHWVPFAVSRPNDALVIDQRAGARHGWIGEHRGMDTYFESWESYSDMLADTVDGLENHLAVAGELPVVINGALAWRAIG